MIREGLTLEQIEYALSLEIDVMMQFFQSPWEMPSKPFKLPPKRDRKIFTFYDYD